MKMTCANSHQWHGEFTRCTCPWCGLPPVFPDGPPGPADPAPVCPECGEAVYIDCTSEYNQEKPWERSCLACGWFDLARYITEEAARRA